MAISNVQTEIGDNMSKLAPKDFMDKVKEVLGDRDDDLALSFLEDCKDTITEEKNDWKEKYETVVKEKEELDKSWRTKYKERFYSSDNPSQDNDKDKEKDKGKKDPFDTRSDAQREAEETTIDSLFTENTEKE